MPKPPARRRVCGFDAGGAPSTLGEARGDLLQCARGGSLQDENGLVDTAEADRGAVEAREDFWSVSGDLIYRHHIMPRENCMYRQNHPSQSLQNRSIS